MGDLDYRCVSGHDLCRGGASAGPSCPYCERVPADPEPDVMDQTWCCLACSQTFRFGQLRMRERSEAHPHGLACPKCGSGNIHPADGTTHELDSYGGEVGTLN